MPPRAVGIIQEAPQHSFVMATTIFLEQHLSSDTAERLRMLGAIAEEEGIGLYLVGGSVRDCLLGRPVVDLDLTSEAPAESVAQLLAGATGGGIHARSQFGTLKLALGGWTVDLTTARSERYARPGALPTVFRGIMAQDLVRRDFSINAMAVALGSQEWGLLLDPTGGEADLRKGVLRALHGSSFQDDATRILRAVRYAVRLEFSIEPRTMEWLRRDLACLETISPARVRREVERFLAEVSPAAALLRAHQLGVLGAIHPALGKSEVGQTLRGAQSYLLEPLSHLGVLTYGATPEETEAIARRLALTLRQCQVVTQVQQLKAELPWLAQKEFLPHEITEHLERYTPSSVSAVASVARGPLVRARLRRYLQAWRRIRPVLGGRELLLLGVRPGPRVGQLLRRLRNARLDGRIQSRKAEVAYVRAALAEVQA